MLDQVEKRRLRGLALLNRRRLVSGIQGISDGGKKAPVANIDGGTAELHYTLRNLAEALVRLLRIV